jgi:membrane protein DedA with SNARE-associated domain
MSEQLFELLEQWGVWGVLASLFIEGTAFPFVGTFFIVTVGFVMEDLTWLDIAWISLVGSFLYALGSYIPYYIGYAVGGTIVNRLKPKQRANYEKVTAAFSRYGIWSVAISSPLHLGNIVPFAAGVSRMKLGLYTALTMLGIAPSTFLLLSLGRLYPGDRDAAIAAIAKYQYWVLAGFVLITVAFIAWKRYCKRLPAAARKYRERM